MEAPIRHYFLRNQEVDNRVDNRRNCEVVAGEESSADQF